MPGIRVLGYLMPGKLKDAHCGWCSGLLGSGGENGSADRGRWVFY